MDTLRLKPRRPLAEQVESWDDDDLVIDGDDLSFQNSLTTAAAPAPAPATTTHSGPPRRRDSSSSHVSLRSDLESCHGEEKQLHIPAGDESSTMDAIAAAEHAGIPIPKNISCSALMGGTIKRLGGRKIRKIIQEDWENDLELPDTSQSLEVKPKLESDFPDTLRQVSGGSVQTSPTSILKSLPAVTAPGERRTSAHSTTSVLPSVLNLDRFKDTDDDDFFGDGGDTIKVSKSRLLPKPVSFITPPTPRKTEKTKESEDDLENDLELPSDGKLSLSTKRDIPKTPSSQADELDWGEGSLGTRYGGTRRDGRSNRSSSASALSPSVSSSITAESEDETFEGLVLPAGPVNFRERLQQRKKSTSPERILEEPELSPKTKKYTPVQADRQDFFEGLEIGDGKVFDAGKLTLHRNIKIKESRPASPARPKAAISLTFTNKHPVQTRIPRLSHERAHSTSLEPVYESGGSAIPQRGRRSQSRVGHSSQSSITSLPTPTTTSPGRSMPPSTPQRREVGPRSSFTSLRTEPPSTTSAQLLKQKRSLPAVRGLNTPAKTVPSRSDRPSSSADASRPPSGLRPKTPVERQRTGISESLASQTRRPHLPFLPAGASQSQSQHVTSKTLRQFRRHDSDNAIDIRPFSRPMSRSATRSPSPQRYRVAADTWERLSKPKNKKHFGDGHELDGFDDLPTSRETETRFLKQPLAQGLKTTIRKGYQNILPDRMMTPAPSSPFSPVKMAQRPHFARDTAASRIARETALAHRAPSSGTLAPVAVQKEAQLMTRNNLGLQPHLTQQTIRASKRYKRPPQLKPHLISNLNTGKESKVVNGMFYNAETFSWEGNEHALNIFDSAPVSTPSTISAALHLVKDREATTPRPALITNISATKGVQVVGGMVFDPQNMCWLKIDPQSNANSETSDTLDGFNALDDEEDVFKDIPDLEDNAAAEERRDGRGSDMKDDWLVGEEFDVGPEFVRRQREEEDRWRKKCEKWVGRGARDREVWRWTIRDLVSQFDDLPM